MTLSIVDTFDMIDMDHEENNEIMFKEDSCMFNLSVTNDDLMKRRVEEYAKRLLKKRTYATKINFEEVNKKNKDLGTAGELLAFEYEQNRLVSEHIPYNAEYVANTIGDGLGYDILSYDKDGNEIHIEVKTTRTSNEYGFFMSKREIEESLRSRYKIYRVYNFDEENKSADMKIIDGEVTEKNFVMEATNYRIVGIKNK